MANASSSLLTFRRWWPAAVAVAAWTVWLLWVPPRPSHWLVVALGAVPAWLVARTLAARDGTTWRAHLATHADWYALGAALLYAMGIQVADAPGITTDGAIYFSQLRSVVVDGDLDVAREFALLGQPARPSHFVPVGPTLFWLPLYLVVAAIDAVGRAVGVLAGGDPAMRGLTLPYVRAALVGSFAVGAAGLAAVHALVRRDHGRATAALTTLLIFAATPLAWYMVYEASMTHAASFGTVAVLVYFAVRWQTADGYAPTAARRLGTLAALAFLMRPQDALFAVVPAVLAVGPGAGGTARLLGLARHAVVGAAPWLVLQAVHSAVLVGSNDFQLVGQQGYLDPWHSRWIDTLFSSWHGLLSWSPVVYVAVVGTVALARRRLRWALLALGLLLAMAWVNGSTVDWAGGWSFGGRRFTSVLVMLAPGLALVLDGAVRRPHLVVGAVAALAVVWNYGLMVQFTAGMVPKDEPVSFGRVIRQQADLATRSPFLYPFAFPANAWFAWREGLPVDRYDLLASEPVRADVDLPFDGRSERFLLGGWEAPGGDQWGAHWWLNGSPATIAVPLDVPARQPATLEITARTRYEEPAVAARLELRVNGRPAGQFEVPADAPTTERLTVPATAGLWRRGFNRIEIVSLGVRRLDPGDSRPPGTIARRLDGRPWPVAVYRLQIRSSR
ncbi:MAG: hypothetical protein AB7U83_10335 [Vicinamibacterales bacterium]